MLFWIRFAAAHWIGVIVWKTIILYLIPKASPRALLKFFQLQGPHPYYRRRFPVIQRTAADCRELQSERLAKINNAVIFMTLLSCYMESSNFLKYIQSCFVCQGFISEDFPQIF